MRDRQAAIDALNKYTQLNEAYGALLDQMRNPGGLSMTATELERFFKLGEDLDAARQDHDAKFMAWQESQQR